MNDEKIAIEALPPLTLAMMANQAAEVAKEDTGWGIQGDLACHVLALIEQLKWVTEACAVAHNHLDTYGIVQGVVGYADDREVASQAAAFDALRPFTKACGDRFVSIYTETTR